MIFLNLKNALAYVSAGVVGVNSEYVGLTLGKIRFFITARIKFSPKR
jgi:hypothetical protein